MTLLTAGERGSGSGAEAQLVTRLGLLRAEYGRLLTAARAAVAAAGAGEDFPLAYLAAELARQGQLPAVGVSSREVLEAGFPAGVIA
jgi:hypothetical protein